MWRTGLAALRHVGYSMTRDRTRVPCIGRRILNHCATREAPSCTFKSSPHECKLVPPLWKTVWRCLKKLKIEVPCNPAIPLLGIPEKTKTLIQKDACTLMFIAVLFTVAKIGKQPECPSTDEWIKMWCIYNGILLSHRKEWNFAICNDMDGLGGHYAK